MSKVEMAVFNDRGQGVNGIYPQVIRQILRNEQVPTEWHGKDTTKSAFTWELHPAVISITNPARRLVTSRPMNVVFAMVEVMWILSGSRDVSTLEYYNSNIRSFSDDGVVFNAAYGYRMRQHFGVDQLEDVIKTLKSTPHSRQATIVLSAPDADRGWDVYGEPRLVKDRACNVLAHLMIRGGQLDWMQIIRSNDAVWGTPYNFMQWLSIMEYVACQLDVPMGTYQHVVDSLHIYEHHEAEAKSIISGGPLRVDLYEHTGMSAHPVMSISDITLLSRMELKTRTTSDESFGPTILDGYLSTYEKVFLHLCWVHRLYRERQNVEAIRQLHKLYSFDPVTTLSQARFYFANRWCYNLMITEIYNNLFGRLLPEGEQKTAERVP